MLAALAASWHAGALAADTALWFAQGRPAAAARQAVDILAASAADGLEPRDYDADELRRALSQAESGPLAPDAETLLDETLTAAMQRYLADLHGGRVDPRRIHENFSAAPDPHFDPPGYLRGAVAAHRLPEAVREAAPSFPLYGTLRQALARYRALAASPAWQAPLPPLPGKTLTRGQAYAGLPVLTQRLLALGDLPAGTPVPARYEGALVEGVKAFQARHGLEAAGTIGAGTFAQLNVPPASRVRQIELTMERLRWTPLLEGRRMIVVNVPEFVLRAYEVRDGSVQVKAEMKVIVGKALDTRTPLFKEDMRYIEFSPYWNVPPSIARAETVPRLRRDPGYFARQGFEFVGADGKAVTTLSAASLDAVQRGELRIRQRPGPKNALGDIKFIFPNNDNIYLHHTPAPQLFTRDRRDLSHGCIRVEAPVALASFVLQDTPGWTDTRIREAMEKGQSSTLRLQQPLPVVLAYGTALAKADGRIYFFSDIYGLDKVLDDALRQRGAGRTGFRADRNARKIGKVE
ncbi:L,D-transpeptidase family protein [Cupriavidus basilensis]|uniref:L,D-transpeptidase family protein n=1 Tax=Cupriavidus basilensis TaxID=68895 RepID=A0ABT6B134_9BURK|nr:L,D-transpeptidase family protein [Cupriavidus basilensis]MDF3838197.1 L,D-transpeptidase family protein [Cupriavidus basilensis]